MYAQALEHCLAIFEALLGLFQRLTSLLKPGDKLLLPQYSRFTLLNKADSERTVLAIPSHVITF
jgi:hypothetical protein